MIHKILPGHHRHRREKFNIRGVGAGSQGFHNFYVVWCLWVCKSEKQPFAVYNAFHLRWVRLWAPWRRCLCGVSCPARRSRRWWLSGLFWEPCMSVWFTRSLSPSDQLENKSLDKSMILTWLRIFGVINWCNEFLLILIKNIVKLL